MKDSLEDLSVRARRGTLSSAERRKLEILLRASSEANLWHRAGCEFDAEDTVQTSDHDVAERVMRRVLSDLPRKNARRGARAGVLMVAAVLLVASVSAAAIVSVHYLSRPAEVPARASAVTPSARPLTTVRRSVVHEPAAARPLPRLVESAPAAMAVAQPPSAATATPKPTLAPGGAAELFSAAARARRAGDANQAIVLFDSLQSRFPSSPEARASDMTLGMLHLKRGAAESALQHFRRYLRHSSRGQLAPEALFSEAQALAALGRHAESRRSLATLLERYPDSAYAKAARSKLHGEPSTR